MTLPLIRVCCALLYAAASTTAVADVEPFVCHIGAFVKETDPAGLNVRQAPSTKAKVLGKLPAVVANRDFPGYQVKVEVDVLASERGWLLIEDARDNTELTGQPARHMFSGRGWVSGTQLTVKSQARQGHALPSTNSEVSARLQDGSSWDGDAFVNAGQLVGCQGPWALIEFTSSRLPSELVGQLILAPQAQKGLPLGRFRAWFAEICGNQESSCDGTASKAAAAAPRR